MKGIMIAGTNSGVGKTTISLGIMKALTNRAINVAPFKVGPDYIDPKFHEFVTGNSSYNLDSYLLDEEKVKYLFDKNSKSKDISVIEGVMGLYDGFGIEKDKASSSHIAKILNIPIILVVDGRGMSLSLAALISGFKNFDEEINIAGVIINNVSSEMHFGLLKTIVEKENKIPCIGYLPKDLSVSLKSRHLGLIPAEEVEELEEMTIKLSEIIEKTIDIDKILEISKIDDIKVESPMNIEKKYDLNIGIMKDKAFNFYYRDNLDLLEKLGVNLVPISPLKDEKVPHVDGLYIGGGFPEVFKDDLEKNQSFRIDLKEKLENGLPAYAECGGLMYLTNSISDLENNKSEMVGFINTDSHMTKRLQRFGYIEIDFKGMNIRAHEFHRSMIDENSSLEYMYDISKRRNEKIFKRWKCGIRKKNTIAAYPHIHFYSNLDFLYYLLDFAKKIKIQGEENDKF
ncbi:MAG: cobyrinate a,c-diamide synthase [Senegalia sp. (in: firmicutes)]|uniref:cobyrinate a,c-diamide synthase n=1 Tax=Senegalia sp. (in: firmicutes) TaxID=1924098 RepID=UPI003F9E3932